MASMKMPHTWIALADTTVIIDDLLVDLLLCIVYSFDGKEFHWPWVK
jgi:hypothetical protein